MEGEYMKGNTQDLTKGSIVKAIILFSVPLLIIGVLAPTAARATFPT